MSCGCVMPTLWELSSDTYINFDYFHTDCQLFEKWRRDVSKLRRIVLEGRSGPLRNWLDKDVLKDPYQRSVTAVFITFLPNMARFVRMFSCLSRWIAEQKRNSLFVFLSSHQPNLSITVYGFMWRICKRVYPAMRIEEQTLSYTTSRFVKIVL